MEWISKATIEDLQHILYQDDECPPLLRDKVLSEWKKRVGVKKQLWIKTATNQQLQMIFHHDSECPTALQEQVESELNSRGIRTRRTYSLTPKQTNWIWSATDEQLKVILAEDSEIPKPLLHLAVHEAIDRRLYEGYILSVIQSLFPSLDALKRFEMTYALDLNDLKQIGYMGMFRAVNTFKSGKSGFEKLIYTPVRRALITEIKKYKTAKRKGETISINRTILSDGTSELEEIMIHPHSINVEKVVLQKIDVEKFLSLLNKEDKEVVILRCKGFEYWEIGKMLGKSRSWAGKRYSISLSIMKAEMLLEKGYSTEEIAELLEVTEKWVLKHTSYFSKPVKRGA